MFQSSPPPAFSRSCIRVRLAHVARGGRRLDPAVGLLACVIPPPACTRPTGYVQAGRFGLAWAGSLMMRGRRLAGPSHQLSGLRDPAACLHPSFGIRAGRTVRISAGWLADDAGSPGWIPHPLLPPPPFPKEALKAPQASRGARRRAPWPGGPHDVFSCEDAVVGGLRTFPNSCEFGRVRGYAANSL